jgi:hypothetical protein
LFFSEEHFEPQKHRWPRLLHPAQRRFADNSVVWWPDRPMLCR